MISAKISEAISEERGYLSLLFVLGETLASALLPHWRRSLFGGKANKQATAAVKARRDKSM